MQMRTQRGAERMPVVSELLTCLARKQDGCYVFLTILLPDGCYVFLTVLLPDGCYVFLTILLPDGCYVFLTILLPDGCYVFLTILLPDVRGMCLYNYHQTGGMSVLFGHNVRLFLCNMNQQNAHFSN